MAGLTVTSAASIDPVTVAELRNYARIDDGIDSTLLTALIKAATNWCEEYTNRVFITRTLRLSLDGISEFDVPLKEGMYTAPYTVYLQNYIELPKPPLGSVSSIVYFDDSDNQSTWDTSNYYVDAESTPPRVVLRDGGAWPTDLRNANGIQVTYTAGYGSNATDVPEAIRIAIQQYATHLYEHRGDDEGRGLNSPALVQNLLQPYKVMRYGVSSLSTRYAS